jgi:hypothetical protein
MLQINNPLKTPKGAPSTHSSIRYGDLSRRRYQYIELTFSDIFQHDLELLAWGLT